MCEETLTLNIEGLAMIGEVDEYRVVTEDKKYRIVVRLKSGRELCTPLLDKQSLELIKRLLDYYTKVVYTG